MTAFLTSCKFCFNVAVILFGLFLIVLGKLLNKSWLRYIGYIVLFAIAFYYLVSFGIGLDDCLLNYDSNREFLQKGELTYFQCVFLTFTRVCVIIQTTLMCTFALHVLIYTEMWHRGILVRHLDDALNLHCNLILVMFGVIFHGWFFYIGGVVFIGYSLIYWGLNYGYNVHDWFTNAFSHWRRHVTCGACLFERRTGLAAHPRNRPIFSIFLFRNTPFWYRVYNTTEAEYTNVYYVCNVYTDELCCFNFHMFMDYLESLNL
eukprot:TRINITY_DN694_c0_g1_i1.p1 TRINITY_DN694_c0_g1~~TRINITY_DN694_c0_g1_i1.p1  ORF type:complete len:261 (+),score=-95.50 TRINITY_DN694_c0_g1_i1:112-894(+)